MAVLIAGTSTATKVLQPGYPMKNRDEAGRWALEYLYLVSKAEYENEAPAHASAAPAPEVTIHTTVACSGVQMVNSDDPHNVYMRVFYTEPSAGAYVSGSNTVRSSSAAFIERRVDEIAGISSANVIASKDNGRTTVPYFTVSYHRRSYDGSFTWSEANVISGIGKRAGPTGMSSPTANAWLKTERNITEVDSGVEIEDVWTYDENGWNTAHYGT